MKLYINRMPVNGPYGGGNGATKAIFQHMVANNYTCDGKSPDTLLALGLDAENGGASLTNLKAYKSSHGVRLFLRVNDCDARKNTTDVDKRLVDASHMVDGTIFVSHWMRDYFINKGWACKNNTVIVNGVDETVFYPRPREPLEGRPLRICSHHWSDNRMKSGDITRALSQLATHHPDRFTFTFIGRTKLALPANQHVQPLYGVALGEELAKHDVYVSESLFDPGPNHCSEAIASGLPTYVHKNGGGAVEFAGLDHTFSSWDDLHALLMNGVFLPNTTSFRTWQQFAEDVYEFINRS